MRKVFKEFFSILNIINIALIILTLIFTVTMKVLIVNGTSMEPTYHNGDCLLGVRTVNFERDDIVSVYVKELDTYVIKRVLAVSGDYVVSSPVEVIVNGETVMQIPGEYLPTHTGIVPEGNVFLVGDNYIDSYDSRYTGSVPIGGIAYRVVKDVQLPHFVHYLGDIAILIAIFAYAVYLAKARRKSQKEINYEEQKQE